MSTVVTHQKKKLIRAGNQHATIGFRRFFTTSYFHPVAAAHHC